MVKRDDWGSAFTVLDRRGRTWPSALWEGLGEQRGRGGGLPAQGLVEHELGHGCRGVLPVGQGLGRLSPSGGPRAGASSGGVVGSPRQVRMQWRAGAWVMKAMMRIWAAHLAQRRGKTS